MFGAVAIFKDVPNDNDWLDGLVPNHPDFEGVARIQGSVTTIKAPLLNKILEGCEKLVQTIECPNPRVMAALNDSIRHHVRIWEAVISGHKYGVIYLSSRWEARNLHVDVIRSNPLEAQLIDNFLCQDNAVIRALNYGVHQFIHDASIEKNFASRFIPPFAIAAVGEWLNFILQGTPCSFTTLWLSLFMASSRSSAANNIKIEVPTFVLC